MDQELAWLSAFELRELIGAGSVSPVEVVQACLERIDVVEPHLHSFITVAADRALEQARVAERAVARGENLGTLHGVPVALKDEIWTEGIASTGGSLVFRRFVPSKDATVAERLRAAGAIIIGKTQLPEFASWPRSKTRLVDESVNPWDMTRISGASSGGSGACVAAGLVPLAVGSDGGGSIRIPSSLCGIFGLYPTPGRVSSYGTFSYSTAGSLGPMARTVRDAALLQQVISGPDARDAWALTGPAPDTLVDLESGVRGLRIAWSEDFGHIPVAPGVGVAVQRAVSALGDLGATVETTDRHLAHPWGDEAATAATAAMQHEVAARHWELDNDWDTSPELSAQEDWMWSVFADTVPFTTTARFRALIGVHRELLAPHSQLTLDAPVRAPDPDADHRREDLLRSMSELFERYDVLCSPTMAVVAPIAPEGWGSPYSDPFMGTNFTFLANATGCPAASVPCGLVNGLPIGLQVVGRPGAEATVLRVSRALQELQPPPPRPPNLT